MHDQSSPLRWSLVGVPSSAGGRRTGQEHAPAALRAARLLERLCENGWDVADLGDSPPVSFRPDPEHPRQQNLDLVVEVARQTAERIDLVAASGRVPLVLGGDCSLSLGVLAGLVRHHQHLGLLYFDGDVDLETPETTPSGIFDGMVLSHVLGRGAPALAGVGPRRPLLSEEDVVVFGYDVRSGFTDPPELEALARSRMSKYPVARVRENPAGAAGEALRHLQRRSEAFLLHFDVDVMDFPAAELPHPNGLDVDSAFAAFRVFAAAPECAGIVITELNVDNDPDGAHVESLVHRIVEAFGKSEASLR
jgi:arginase